MTIKSNLLGGDKPLSDNEACLVAAYYLRKSGADVTDSTIREWLRDPPSDVKGREFVVRDISQERVAECARALANEGLMATTSSPLLAIETALRFYANPKSWEVAGTDVAPALKDHGVMARNALTVIARFSEEESGGSV